MHSWEPCSSLKAVCCVLCAAQPTVPAHLSDTIVAVIDRAVAVMFGAPL